MILGEVAQQLVALLGPSRVLLLGLHEELHDLGVAVGIADVLGRSAPPAVLPQDGQAPRLRSSFGAAFEQSAVLELFRDLLGRDGPVA
jgi:hypothetical protein